MKKARLLPALVLALLFLLPAGCGKPAAAQPTPKPAETVTASGRCRNAARAGAGWLEV